MVAVTKTGAAGTTDASSKSNIPTSAPSALYGAVAESSSLSPSGGGRSMK